MAESAYVPHLVPSFLLTLFPAPPPAPLPRPPASIPSSSQVGASNHLTRNCLSHSSPKVLAASGLVKRDLFSLPNPFAVITTDGSDLRQTTVFKRTLTPYWNETFELFRALSPLLLYHPLILP